MTTLRIGDVGPAVGYAQDRLRAHGALVTTDNDFGPRTLQAVKAVQRAHGLPDDGVIGADTWAVLARGKPSTSGATESERMSLRAAVADVPEPRRAVLLLAIADVGKAEDPPGSNRGLAIAHLEPAGVAWCASAVCSWVRLGLGVSWPSSPFNRKLARVLEHPQWPSLEGWAKDTGRLRSEAAPGAIYLMARGGSGSDAASGGGAGHCGLVVGMDGGRLLTIDGNVSDRVAVCRRDPGSLRGFVHWWLP